MYAKPSEAVVVTRDGACPPGVQLTRESLTRRGGVCRVENERIEPIWCLLGKYSYNPWHILCCGACLCCVLGVFVSRLSRTNGMQHVGDEEFGIFE